MQEALGPPALHAVMLGGLLTPDEGQGESHVQCRSIIIDQNAIVDNFR